MFSEAAQFYNSTLYYFKEYHMRCYNCMKELKNGTKFCPYCGKKPDAENPAHHLPIGTELHNKYIVGNSIGEGGFGITYIGYDKTLDIRIAVKEYFPSGYANRNNTVSKNVTLNKSNLSEYFNHGKESFMREAKNIAKFSSEDGIVDVRDYFTENETAYIVMEYLDGENLGNYIGKHGNFSAEKIFSLLLPIMRSLDKMHREGIIHRDISPDNIMYLKTGELKLMDFGSARYFSSAEQKTMSIMLKPGYAPYEQYSANGHQGPWTDVYGICATIYKCITNVTPPDSLDRCQNDTLKKPSDLGADITEELENVLMYGLAIYHDNRCQSMTDLIEITEKALNNEPFTFIHSENTEMQKTIDRIKAADERYKTMFAASDYSPPRPTPNQWQHNNQQQLMFSQQPLPQGNWNNYPPQPPQPNNKSNTALIAVLISLAALVIAATVIVIVFLMNNNDSGNTNQGTEEAVEATASAESGVPTSAPTTSESTTVKVADVTGKKLAEAKKALEDQGFVVNTVEEYSDTVEEGYVIRQSAEGNNVTLYVSKGAEPIVDTSVETTPNITPSKATYFSSAAASSVLSSQTDPQTKITYNYKASNVLNNDDYCWCEGANGIGIGEWIQLYLPEKQRLYGLRIINGYAGNEQQYTNNGKVSKVMIEFSNKQSINVSLEVYSTAERNKIQAIDFSNYFAEGYVNTEYVIITILDVEKAKYDDTCITYIEPY